MPINGKTLKLDGFKLTLEDFFACAVDFSSRLSVDQETSQRIAAARKTVENIQAEGGKAYGINTGFGRLADVRIEARDINQLQENLILSHAVGVGRSFSPEEVRAIFLLRIQGLLQGHSGVRPELVDTLLEGFNRGLLPVIPEQGSCGASGDLAPLAHLALVFLGRGRAWVRQSERNSDVLPGSEALAKIGLKPVTLSSKEGLALINGTQVLTAIGALSLARLEILLKSADIIGGMSLEALMGSQSPFHAAIQKLRPHPGQQKVAANLLALLKGSAIMQAHRDCSKVQDAYSLRCMPQVHGAARDAATFAKGVIECEMNSVTDNPLIFPEHESHEQVLSGGNFHGQPVAQVLDFLAIGATDLASISERRIERLLNPDLSELPAFLAAQEGLHSGLMMLQVTAASLVSECKIYAHPASADSIPTSANKEDHVSMGTTAARKLRQIVDNLSHVLAIEMICAAKALEYRRPLKSGIGIEAAYSALRQEVKTFDHDREMGPDIENARRLLLSSQLIRAVQTALPALQ